MFLAILGGLATGGFGLAVALPLPLLLVALLYSDRGGDLIIQVIPPWLKEGGLVSDLCRHVSIMNTLRA